MSIMSDRWITRMAREHGMIEPFEDRQVRAGVISCSLAIRVIQRSDMIDMAAD